MELFRALGALVEPPVPAHAALAAILELGPPPGEAAHSDLFLFQLYPYASVYTDAEGMLGGEARDRVAGFWRALGEPPPAEPDHLAVMLALYSRLAELEAGAETPALGARWRHARGAFLWEHLLAWLPAYLVKLAEVAPPFYRRWGELLAEALGEASAGLDAPPELPLHLRSAPALADPRQAGAGGLVGSLLAPVVSGLILVRDDLRRAASELGLACRAGERRFVLEALLGQDASATLAWLAGEAGAWASRHQAGGAPPPIAAFWAARAEATADLLAELAGEA